MIVWALAAASFVAAEWYSQDDRMFAFYLLPTRAWELLMGAGVALIHSRHRTYMSSHFLIRETVTAFGLIAIVYAICAFDKNTPVPGVYALIPTVGAAAIILYAGPQTIVGKLLGSRPFVGIGLISYSAYLWHQPLFAFARHRSTHEPGTTFMLLLSIASLIIAYPSWRFVEIPFRSRDIFSRTQIFTGCVRPSPNVPASPMVKNINPTAANPVNI